MVFDTMIIGGIPSHHKSLLLVHKMPGIIRPYLESWSRKIFEVTSENVADGYANMVTDNNTIFA